MAITKVGIRELRDGLSRHLAAVRDGTEIMVTDRGRPVARITSIEAESGFEVLLREGIATVPAVRRHPLPTRIATEGSVSDLVAAQHR